jgi:hypothetical protein
MPSSAEGFSVFHSLMHMMIVRLLAACAMSLLSFGCGHKASPEAGGRSEGTEQTQNSRPDQPGLPAATPMRSASASSSGGISQPAAPPSAQPTAAQTGASDASAAARLGELTQALRRYSVEQQRVPTSLGEMVAAGYVKSLPQAPPGKKLAINPKRLEVVLVNQ